MSKAENIRRAAPVLLQLIEAHRASKVPPTTERSVGVSVTRPPAGGRDTDDARGAA